LISISHQVGKETVAFGLGGKDGGKRSSGESEVSVLSEEKLIVSGEDNLRKRIIYPLRQGYLHK
jgi:hypothetical protein